MASWLTLTHKIIAGNGTDIGALLRFNALLFTQFLDPWEAGNAYGYQFFARP